MGLENFALEQTERIIECEQIFLEALSILRKLLVVLKNILWE